MNRAKLLVRALNALEEKTVEQFDTRVSFTCSAVTRERIGNARKKRLKEIKDLKKWVRICVPYVERSGEL